MALMLRFMMFRQKFYREKWYKFKYNEKKIENKLFSCHAVTPGVERKFSGRVHSIRSR